MVQIGLITGKTGRLDYSYSLIKEDLLKKIICEQARKLTKSTAARDHQIVLGDGQDTELLEKLKEIYPKQPPILGRKVTYIGAYLFALATFGSAVWGATTLVRRSLGCVGISRGSLQQLPNAFWKKAAGSVVIFGVSCVLSSFLNRRVAMGDHIAAIDSAYNRRNRTS